MALITVKPVISSPGFEFDSRTLQFANGDTVVLWEDQSGQGKHATAVNSPEYDTTGWPRGSLPSVRLKETDSDHFTFDGSDFIGTNFTLFFVVEATDIGPAPSLAGVPIMGGSTTSRDLGMIQVGIASNGSVVFALFDTSGGQNDITSATGLVASGDLCIITCRHSSADGKILRLNGEQIGSVAATDHVNSWDDPYIGRIQSAFFGIDKRFVWLAGYKTAATDKQVEDMECYLSGLFGVYVKSCLPPDPAIFDAVFNRNMAAELELAQSMTFDLQLEGTITEDLEISQSMTFDLQLEGTITEDVDA